MEQWIKTAQPFIEKFYRENINNTDKLFFKATDNLELEIQKEDGTRVRIFRWDIELCRDDEDVRACTTILSKLKSFKIPEGLN